MKNINTIDSYPYLCGGTFFSQIVLWSNIKQNNKSISEAEILKKLLIIYNSDIINNTQLVPNTHDTSNFKGCLTNYPSYF